MSETLSNTQSGRELAISISQYCRNIFQFVTNEQVQVVATILMRLPGPEPGYSPVTVGEGILRLVAARASNGGRLIPWEVTKEVDAERKRRGFAVDSGMERTMKIRQDMQPDRKRVDDRNAWAQSLSRNQIEEHTTAALMALAHSDIPMMQDFQKRKKTVANSNLLAGLAYEQHRAMAAFK